jgi:hypothetical protein
VHRLEEELWVPNGEILCALKESQVVVPPEEERYVMKTIMRLMLVSLLVVVAAPSYSESGEAWHVYQCEVLDDTSEDQIVELVETWLKAARTVKGGESVEVYVFFPVAAEMGASDLRILVKVPSFAEWGAFWDVYDESAAADVEDSWSEVMDCPDSWLFEGFKIETE